MPDMKPILFNTDMVRAILDCHKTVTRRVVKCANQLWRFDAMETNPAMTKVRKNGEEYSVDVPGLWAIFESDGYIQYPMIKAPYQIGDILYVRETWRKCCMNENSRKGHSDYCYKASITSQVYGCIDRYTEHTGCKWHPSIHMKKEATRIFLRVTDMRVERLQDITEEGSIKEGFEPVLCNHPGGYPCTDCMNTGYLEPAMLDFVDTWNRTIKPADRALYGWDANPWVWVIEFERISRE